jgi:hypothetical protein
VYDANCGAVTESDGELRVSFEFPQASGWDASFPSRFRFDRADGRRRISPVERTRLVDQPLLEADDPWR